jgi:hypothetical protein
VQRRVIGADPFLRTSQNSSKTCISESDVACVLLSLIISTEGRLSVCPDAFALAWLAVALGWASKNARLRKN